MSAARLPTYNRHAAALVMGIVGLYYLWAVQAAGYGFHWRSDLAGYYNHLARGFAGGHLYVPIQPSPELLAMPDPWDPSIDDRYRMQDMALFHGHYYLYFGAAPAAVLFLPWRIVTGHDLPENFALFLLCYGGYLFYCAAFLRLLRSSGRRPGPLLLSLMLLALGLCQSVPFLLSRVWVYEVAIGSGYFFTAAAIYFLTRGLAMEARHGWLAASGMMFGLAAASRPDLLLAGFIAAASLWFYKPGGNRRVLGFMFGLAAILAVVAAYNHQRYGNPFEFGFRYQLVGRGQNRVDVSLAHLIPGTFHFLLAPPEFTPVFPWIRIVLRRPFALPADYFLEPTIGALWLAPFLIGGLFLPVAKRSPQVRILLLIAALSAATLALFLMSTHLVTQRYEVDFLPIAVFAVLSRFAVVERPVIATVLLVITVLFGTAVNLALGITGPYEEMLANRPRQYVRLARALSPIARFRPVLNPDVHLEFDHTPQPGMARRTVIALGRGPHSYSLYAEGSRLISETDQSTLSLDLPPQPLHLRLTHSAGFILLENEGRTLLRHPLQALVMAPSQLVVAARLP